MPVYVQLLSLTDRIIIVPQKAKCIACCIMICHGPGCFYSVHRPRKEEDLVSETSTCTKEASMHSDTTGFVVNAFAPPVPIKGHYGFSTSSNHRQSSSQPIHCGHTDVSRVVVQRNSDSSTNFIIIITDENESATTIKTGCN